MVEVCSPAVSEDRGHMSKVDGPESLKIILLLIHCLVDMPASQARLSYLVMSRDIALSAWWCPKTDELLYYARYLGLGMRYEAGICTIVISMNRAFKWCPFCCKLNFDPKSWKNNGLYLLPSAQISKSRRPHHDLLICWVTCKSHGRFVQWGEVLESYPGIAQWGHVHVTC